MRSAELAQRAGVTVRTLRHYHQLGILSEPTRGANGYREYRVQHLVRVLRLKNLGSAGVPLEAAAQMIDETNTGTAATSTAASLLDEIDRELALKIEVLTAQRAAIAAARASNTTPDLPSGLLDFAHFLSDTAGAGSTARDQLVLLANLDERSDAGNVSALLDGFGPLRQQLVAISDGFDALTDMRDVPAMTKKFRQFQVDVAASLPSATLSWLLEPRTAALLDMYTRETLNPAQAAVFDAFADDGASE
jgi:DNA-binding transcriptional MerR regulator